MTQDASGDEEWGGGVVKPVHGLSAALVSVAAALLVTSALAQAQDRGRGGKPAEPPAVKGKVAAYEEDKSIAVETAVRGGGVKRTEFSIVKDRTRIELGLGIRAIEPGVVVSVFPEKDNPRNAAKIVAEPRSANLTGKVVAYEADKSITVGINVRGGRVSKTEFAIVKGRTQIELGLGVKAIEPGVRVSVWADLDDPKNAAKVAAEPDAPTVKGKVVAYEAAASITVEYTDRGGGAVQAAFSIVKDKTRIELGSGVKAIEIGAGVSVWAEKDNPKLAAMIIAQGPAAPGRNRGGSGAAPADKEGSAKPAPPAAERKAEDPVDVSKVLEAYRSNLPTDKNLEWYTLDWVNTLGEAKERAAKENRPILFIQTNKEGDLFCSLC